MSESPIRVAIVGAGFFGTTLARACEQHDAFDVVAVTDVHAAGGRALAAELGARFLDGIDEVAAAVDVDLVMVATPNHTHAAAAITLLKAGKHVFVEKPLAIDRQDSLDIVETAAASRGTLVVGHVLRTLPGIRRMFDAVVSGSLGTVLEGYASRARLVHLPSGSTDWWKLDTARSGGELLHEIHELDLLVWFLGEPTAVRCVAGGPLAHGDTSVDSIHKTTLRFASGAVGYHELSTSAHVSDWKLRISGTNEALVADFRTATVTRMIDGATVEEWGLFTAPEANDSLRESATQKQSYNSVGAEGPVWMRAAVTCELDEVAAAVHGRYSVLVAAPAAAVVAGVAAMDEAKLLSSAVGV